jgi:predicted acetyltransferase
MEGLRLVIPDSKYQKEYISFVNECAEDIKACRMDIFITLSDESSFIDDVNSLVKKGEGIGLPNGWVPASTYWLMTEDNNRILGALNIRHKLTDYLLFRGGHIAYYIHQYERRKGYATKMLGLGLKKCRDLGIERVLITCAKKNVGSAKTIINNDGVLHSEDIEEGEEFQRYEKGQQPHTFPGAWLRQDDRLCRSGSAA